MKILAYSKKLKKYGEIIELEYTLEAMQEFVDGYIECVRLPNNICLIVNEEGRYFKNEFCIVDLPTFKNVIYGDFFFCAFDGKIDFTSISDDDASKIKENIKILSK